MQTLITFLGRVPRNQQGQYRQTVYDFEDGTRSEPVAFLGWALQQRLDVQRVVILGTSGSMWDHLFEGDLDLGDAAEVERTALMEAVEQKAVGESQLTALEPLLARQLGCEVVLQLIPYCRSDAEQAALLDDMASHIQPGDSVHIDITHGFRHLPMLGLLSALHLRQVRQARIDGIWYGAYDPDTGHAPVHSLTGLLRIADWLNALSAYERSGDYGVFATLIGGEIGEALSEASFFETVNRTGQARSRLKKALKALEQATDDPALTLFRDELRRRISWAKGDNLYQRQRQLTLEYLARHRYRDAVLDGYEAFITRLARQQGLRPDDPGDREQARNTFDSAEKNVSPRSTRYRRWDSLRRLRNALAHGGQPVGEEVQRALGHREAMQALLEDLFKQLLPEES